MTRDARLVVFNGHDVHGLANLYGLAAVTQGDQIEGLASHRAACLPELPWPGRHQHLRLDTQEVLLTGRIRRSSSQGLDSPSDDRARHQAAAHRKSERNGGVCRLKQRQQRANSAKRGQEVGPKPNAKKRNPRAARIMIMAGVVTPVTDKMRREVD